MLSVLLRVSFLKNYKVILLLLWWCKGVWHPNLNQWLIHHMIQCRWDNQETGKEVLKYNKLKNHYSKWNKKNNKEKLYLFNKKCVQWNKNNNNVRLMILTFLLWTNVVFLKINVICYVICNNKCKKRNKRVRKENLHQFKKINNHQLNQ
jgi:hypothetical protein